MVADTVVLAAIGGLYLSQGILYFKLGGALSDIQDNSETIARNQQLIHDHIIEGTNPHPKSDRCSLCEMRKPYENGGDGG